MKSFSALAIASLSLLVTPIALQSKQTKPASSTAQAKASLQVTQCTLKVSGMTCGGCEAMVKQGLLKLEGVQAATVDYKTGKVEVTYDSKKTSPEKLVTEFNKQSSGFRAGLAKPENKNSR